MFHQKFANEFILSERHSIILGTSCAKKKVFVFFRTVCRFYILKGKKSKIIRDLNKKKKKKLQEMQEKKQKKRKRLTVNHFTPTLLTFGPLLLLPDALYQHIQNYLTILECQSLNIVCRRSMPNLQLIYQNEEFSPAQRVLSAKNNSFSSVWPGYFSVRNKDPTDHLTHCLSKSILFHKREETKIIVNVQCFFKWLYRSRFTFKVKDFSWRGEVVKRGDGMIPMILYEVLSYLHMEEESSNKLRSSVRLYFWIWINYRISYSDLALYPEELVNDDEAIYLLPSKQELGTCCPSICFLLFLFHKLEVSLQWYQKVYYRLPIGKTAEELEDIFLCCVGKLNAYEEQYNRFVDLLPIWLRLPYHLENRYNRGGELDIADSILLALGLHYVELIESLLHWANISSSDAERIVAEMDSPNIYHCLKNYTSLDYAQCIPKRKWDSRMLFYSIAKLEEPIHKYLESLEFSYEDYKRFYSTYSKNMIFSFDYLRLWLKSITSLKTDILGMDDAALYMFDTIRSNPDWIDRSPKWEYEHLDGVIRQCLSAVLKNKSHAFAMILGVLTE